MAKLDKFLTNLERILLGAGLFAASLILFSNVVLRYFFSKGVVWAEESVRYLIIWMVFIGGAVAAREASHINVDVLFNLLPERSRSKALGVVFAVAALFCVGLTIWSANLTLVIKASHQITPGLKMGTYWAYLAIPVGSALMSLRFLQAAWDKWQGGPSA